MTAVLLDQGLAPRTATVLRHRGIDAIHVSEIENVGGRGRPDSRNSPVITAFSVAT